MILPVLLPAKGIDLYSLFPNLTLGSDPNGADAVNCICGAQTASQMDVTVRVVTDNADPFDALQGIELELEATADQAGVTLDTTVATAFTGGAVNGWGIKSIDVVGGDPSSFPMQVKLGAVELDTADAGAPLAAGDHLFATLRFNISSPTNITVDGTTILNGPATLVTTLANGYSATVNGAACGPVVPTLSEWGLIIFGLVLMGGIVWYLRRQKPATVAA
jgi:hypothetical protein